MSRPTRSDLWALGVMLYEMAAGAQPFQGQTGFAVSSASLKEPPAPLPPRVPAGLRAIILRRLAKEPGRATSEQGRCGPHSRRCSRGRRLHLRLASNAPAGPLAAALLAALAIGWGMWIGLRAGRPARIESIAVLPLDNLSGDPAQDYFADGMTANSCSVLILE